MSIETEIKNLTAAINANTEFLKRCTPVTATEKHSSNKPLEVMADVEDVPATAAGTAEAKKEAAAVKKAKADTIRKAKAETKEKNEVIDAKVEADTANDAPATIEDVRDMCIAVNGTGQGVIAKLLEKFGATTATNLDEKHYADIILAGNKLIAKSEA